MYVPEKRHGVADKEMCNVPRHQLVDALGLESLEGRLVDRQFNVVVLEFGGALREVAADGGVPALSYPPFAGLQVLDPTLPPGATVHRGRNYVPPTI